MQLPDTTVLSGWMRTMTEWGYHSVRTSALSPSAAEPLQELGFTISQNLALLRIWNDHSAGRTFIDAVHPLRNVAFLRRPREKLVEQILSVDRAAFDTEWSLDVNTFREALLATRRSRIFVSRTDTLVNGFVVVGATDSHGFIQRLAVSPDHQRSGVATRLIARAMQWTNGQGCTSTVVNTDIENHAALALYRSFGFEHLEYGLSVLERALPQ